MKGTTITGTFEPHPESSQLIKTKERSLGPKTRGGGLGGQAWKTRGNTQGKLKIQIRKKRHPRRSRVCLKQTSRQGRPREIPSKPC